MTNFIAHLANLLEEKKSHGLMRTFSPPCGADFSSNDYFCLKSNQEIIKAATSSLKSFGFGASSSRFIRGHRPNYNVLENNFSLFKRCEKSLFFPSGYLANIGVLSSLVKPNDYIFSDRLNHRSLIDGARLSGANIIVFDHLDHSDLRDKLAMVPGEARKFIVTESLFSMDGDIAPLDDYAQTARDFGAELIVDEAHSVGLYGKKGAGLVDFFGISDEVLCSVNGLGKAFACVGAVVCGRDTVLEYLLQNAQTQIYTTAVPPLVIDAATAALTIIDSGDDLRARLFDNVKFFEQQIEKLLSVPLGKRREIPSPIYPIIIGDNHRAVAVARYLQQKGFDVRAIRPPTVAEGTARLRVSINISHDHSILSALIASIGECL